MYFFFSFHFSFSFFLNYFNLYLSVTACMFYRHFTITSSPRSIRRGSLVLSSAEIPFLCFLFQSYYNIETCAVGDGLSTALFIFDGCLLW